MTNDKYQITNDKYQITNDKYQITKVSFSSNGNHGSIIFYR